MDFALQEYCGRMRIAVFLLTLLAANVAWAQQIVTGNAAARQFLYNGKPIHPLCVDFPQERSSRRGPFPLVKCSDTKVVPTSHPDGWLEAEYPREDGAFFVSSAPFISYKILAKKGDRFLIGSESSGGGSGQFSALLWVRLKDKDIGVSKDEVGGDRCAGRLSNYVTDGSAIRFDVDTPATQILSLSGVQIDASTTGQLRTGYQDCDGTAQYRYDLITEKMELTSVKLNVPDAPEDAARNPQACFDRLVRRYERNRKTTLNPNELKEFGRAFVSTCGVP